jgi:hypothetical protein
LPAGLFPLEKTGFWGRAMLLRWPLSAPFVGYECFKKAITLVADT